MAVTLRPSTPRDIAFITTLERAPGNRDLVGQWSDWEHLSAIDRRNGREHWTIERDGKPAGYLIAYDCRAKDAGIYVKRILVADKEKGTGSEALRQFIAKAAARERVSCVWLVVRRGNDRAQHVYAKLGFQPFEPSPAERPRYDEYESPPDEMAFRMRIAQRT
jgi:ribosomal protein S18 acetylase RimI-like enzyme